MIKKEAYLFLALIFLMLVIPLMSAGFADWFKATITGKAESGPVSLNITVGTGSAPIIKFIRNDTMTSVSGGPNEGPIPTYVLINFTAYDADGSGNLNDSSSKINFSKTGETTRENASCTKLVSYDSNYTNYTCNMTMWWWDGTGNWDISAYIQDNNDNTAYNASAKIFYIGTTDGVELSPPGLNWPTINPGSTNTLSSNFTLLNNTGNIDKWLEVNSTNLVGEEQASFKLYAGNFSVNTTNDCEGIAMSVYAFVNLTIADLPAGNFSLNYGNETSGQEQLYYCLEEAGTELEAQAYSTATEGAWTIKIVTK